MHLLHCTTLCRVLVFFRRPGRIYCMRYIQTSVYRGVHGLYRAHTDRESAVYIPRTRLRARVRHVHCGTKTIGMIIIIIYIYRHNDIVCETRIILYSLISAIPILYILYFKHSRLPSRSITSMCSHPTSCIILLYYTI